MQTTISRRSVALGGPAVLAAGSLGQLGVLGVLGTAPGTATAATLTADGLAHFLINKFQPAARRTATKMMAEMVTSALHPTVKGDGYDVFVDGFYQAWKDNAEFERYINKYFDLSKPDDFFPKYTRQQWFEYSYKIALTSGKNDYIGTAYTSTEHVEYRNWLLSDISNEVLNRIHQHRKELWHHIYQYAAATFENVDFKKFIARVVALEKTDDQRYLRGKTPDALVYKKSWLGYDTNEMQLKLGNVRRAIERKELVNQNSTLGKIFNFKPTYSKRNLIEHGINTTAIETIPTNTKYNGTTEYDFSHDQSEGLDYYVNAEIDKYGPYENMTIVDSKKQLRAYALNVYRMTGEVYISYEVGSLYMRAAAQAIIAVARQFLFDKTINLPAMMDAVGATAGSYPSVIEAQRVGRIQMKYILGLLGGIVVAQALYTALTVFEVDKAVTQGKVKNWTELQMANEAKRKVAFWFTASVSATQLLALGFLGFSSFTTGTSAVQVSRFLGGVFAISDFTAGITRLVSISNKATPSSPSSIANILGACMQLVGATATLADGMYKMWTRSWTPSLFGDKVTALKITAVTATGAACFYGIGGLLLGNGL
jgi:hypothetical protein